MFRELLVLPARRLPMRVAKYDVALREDALWAVLAHRTVLERLVHFTCNVCRESFPAFHPAYDPTGEVSLKLLAHGRGGVAACNMQVEVWDELPALKAKDAELLLASQHTGECRACACDLRQQRASRCAVDDSVDCLERNRREAFFSE